MSAAGRAEAESAVALTTRIRQPRVPTSACRRDGARRQLSQLAGAVPGPGAKRANQNDLVRAC
jgi:hypothetical protein